MGVTVGVIIFTRFLFYILEFQAPLFKPTQNRGMDTIRESASILEGVVFEPHFLTSVCNRGRGIIGDWTANV